MPTDPSRATARNGQAKFRVGFHSQRSEESFHVPVSKPEM
jgi:hypothetical protein